MSQLFLIYHVPSLAKIGCTKNLKRRRGEYPKGTFLEVIDAVLGTEQEAGDREWELADRYGYPRGGHYCQNGGNKGPKAGFVGATLGPWWNDGRTHTRGLLRPGPEWVRGRLFENRDRSSVIGFHWFNNGVRETQARIAPKGYRSGRLARA